jgi:hypothetical protein
MQLTKTGDEHPTLADIDGRVPGRVQLVSIALREEVTPKDGSFMHSYFEEEEGQADPYLRAEGLMRSIEDDWPDSEWAIIGNWRARYLRWVRLQKGMGFLPEESWSPQAFLDCGP